MKKKNRVCKNHEFSSIIQCRTFVKSPGFVFYFVPRKEDHARIGISVGKKLGNAVVRNRIKRQMRALVDSVFTFDEIYDAVIIVRPDFMKSDFAQNKAELEQTRKRVAKRMRKDIGNEQISSRP